MGVEPTATRLKVWRSSTELNGQRNLRCVRQCVVSIIAPIFLDKHKMRVKQVAYTEICFGESKLSRPS